MSWSQTQARLGLGIEPLDAVLGTRVARVVQVEVEGLAGARTPMTRHESARHSLLLDADTRSPIELRLYDRRRGYVPRRLSVPLPDGDDRRAPLRIRRPLMFPGVAWDLVGNATALRSVVTRGGEPVRWARIEARRADDEGVVLRTQADDRGEFLLILAPDTVALTELAPDESDPELVAGLELDVSVWGPPSAPTPPELDGALDPLWDLPVDELAVLADPSDLDTPDPAAAGETRPSGWVELGVARVHLPIARTTSDQSLFVL